MEERGATKRPYRITLKNKELFGFAGLWDTWKSPSGEVINSCSVITTSPNELMVVIHNRMSVILPKEVEHEWLDQGIVDSHFLKSLLIRKVPLTDGHQALYTLAMGPDYAKNYRDITIGSNGTCGPICNAGPGYDFVTGLGSPRANNLVRGLRKQP